MELQDQLKQLLNSLKDLGTELPSILVSLTQVVQPQIPNELRIGLLGTMFQEVPAFLDTVKPQDLQSLIVNPPNEHVTLRLLLDLRQVQIMLASVSYVQLLHLTNNAVPPGPPQQQLQFLTKLQMTFQMWSNNAIDVLSKKLTETPVHLTRQVLMDSQPTLAPELVHLVVELLKMPQEELESQVLIEVKRRLCGGQVPTHHDLIVPPPLSVPSAAWDSINLGDSTMLRGGGSLEIPNDGGTARVGKRDRSGLAKEIINIRMSGTLDPAYESMVGQHTAGYVDEDLPHPKRLGASSVSLTLGNTAPGIGNALSEGFGVSAAADAVSGTADGMDTSAFGDLGPLEWDMAGASLNSSWGTIPPPVATASNALSVTQALRGVDVTQQQMAVDDMDASGGEPQTPKSPLDQMDATSPVPIPVPVVPVTNNFALQNMAPSLQLRIAKQPPAKTVYQRILKPYPAVMLLGTASESVNLFVEATLLRSDSDAELPLCLDGNRVIRISQGVFAVFKRLKILSTSQQQGTLFRLKFQLKRYRNNVFEILQHAVVISNPIEVFSHTQYLSSRKGAAPPPPPTVVEILPTTGPAIGGTRIAILGSNFINTPQLRVKFGEQVVQCQFHESGTLLCFAPAPTVPNATVDVRVTNDGEEYCQTGVKFTYQR